MEDDFDIEDETMELPDDVSDTSDDEVDEDPEVNPVESIVSSIGDENYAAAQSAFAGEINNRLRDAIDQTRVGVASKIFGSQEEVDA